MYAGTDRGIPTAPATIPKSRKIFSFSFLPPLPFVRVHFYTTSTTSKAATCDKGPKASSRSKSAPKSTESKQLPAQHFQRPSEVTATASEGSAQRRLRLLKPSSETWADGLQEWTSVWSCVCVRERWQSAALRGRSHGDELSRELRGLRNCFIKLLPFKCCNEKIYGLK